jgi:hypothetical protein
MAYIGREPVTGNFVKLDSITVVNGQAAYTMNNGGSAFTAYDNVNQFLVSLNGILQAPTDSFTVSGSTLTFASNLATGDVIDFVIVLGDTLDIGTPSDNTVTAAKLNDDIISGSTELASEPADTDEFLVSDAGTLKRIDYSLIKGGGSFSKIANADYSSAVSTFTYTNCFTSDYSVYKFYMFDIDVAANNDELEVKFLDSGGSVVGNWRQVSTELYKEQGGTGSGTGAITADGNNFVKCSRNDLAANTTQPSHLEMTIFLPYESKYTTVHQRFFIRADNGYNYYLNTYAFLESTTSLRSMTMYMNGGTNFASYKSTLYGLTR